MSQVEYERVEFEESVTEREGGVQTPKPFLVTGRQDQSQDQVGRRVAEVLNSELARGSMPA